MELHLNLIGVLMVLLALVHAIFPRQFKWREELAGVSLINRQLMYVHTFFIALTLLLMGALCITSANEIIGTPLGRKIALGFGIFWLVRLAVQFFWYSPELWRGKRLETIVHILFSIIWAYLSFAFFWIYWMGQQNSSG